MRPKIFLFFFFIFLCFLPESCSKNNLMLKDGYYSAEMADFDEFGWKEYVTIRVSGARIIHVEYDARNRSGLIKSWDMEYMRTMNAATGTYPNAYFRYYSTEFLQRQSTEGIDALTGASVSYKEFILLASAVLESARQGKAGIVIVNGPELAPQILPDNNNTSEENL